MGVTPAAPDCSDIASSYERYARVADRQSVSACIAQSARRWPSLQISFPKPFRSAAIYGCRYRVSMLIARAITDPRFTFSRRTLHHFLPHPGHALWHPQVATAACREFDPDQIPAGPSLEPTSRAVPSCRPPAPHPLLPHCQHPLPVSPATFSPRSSNRTIPDRNDNPTTVNCTIRSPQSFPKLTRQSNRLDCYAPLPAMTVLYDPW